MANKTPDVHYTYTGNSSDTYPTYAEAEEAAMRYLERPNSGFSLYGDNTAKSQIFVLKSVAKVTKPLPNFPVTKL